jgi:hypothetical protein
VSRVGSGNVVGGNVAGEVDGGAAIVVDVEVDVDVDDVDVAINECGTFFEAMSRTAVSVGTLQVVRVIKQNPTERRLSQIIRHAPTSG